MTAMNTAAVGAADNYIASTSSVSSDAQRPTDRAASRAASVLHAADHFEELPQSSRLFTFRLPLWGRVLASVAIMAGLSLAVEVFGVPNPNMILIAGLVVCSALFGYPGGVPAAVVMLSYTLRFFSEGHDLVTFTPINAQKVLVVIIGVLVVTFFACSLKRAENRAYAELAHAAELLREDNVLLEEASAIDDLTGLRNRFSLRRDYPRYQALKSDLHVMMVDLDDFKHVNDRFGHECGDYVLGQMGKLLSELFGTNHAYRYGGDEFLVIEPDVTDDEFGRKAKELTNRVRTMETPGAQVPVHCSAGYVSGKPELNGDLRAMFRQADENLYAAKEAGKDQVLGSTFVRQG